jgi:hypothetical protein
MGFRQTGGGDDAPAGPGGASRAPLRRAATTSSNYASATSSLPLDEVRLLVFFSGDDSTQRDTIRCHWAYHDTEILINGRYADMVVTGSKHDPVPTLDFTKIDCIVPVEQPLAARPFSSGASINRDDASERSGSLWTFTGS